MLKGLIKIKRFWKILTVLTVIASIIFLFFFHSRSAQAGWFNDQWYYRTAVTINNTGSEQIDYQIVVTLDTATLITAGKIQSDCDDIRITDVSGKILPHWLQKNGGTSNGSCNSTTTKIWTKMSSLAAGNQVIYIYYGNFSAANVENGYNVFDFFDDFEDGNYTGNPAWTVESGTWTIEPQTFAHGTYTLKQSDASDDRRLIAGSWANSVFEADVYHTAFNSAGCGFTLSGIDEYGIFSSVNLGYHGGTFASVISPLAATTWYKLGYNGLTGISYLNDTVAHDFGVTGSSSRQFRLDCGATSAATYYDDIRVRKTASVEPTVGEPATEEKGPAPVAYWKFDEGYGVTTYDDSSNNNDGTLTSGPTWQAEDVCISGKCLKFDGVDDNVVVADSANLQISGNLTMSAWVKNRSITNNSFIFGKGTDGSKGYVLKAEGSTFYAAFTDTLGTRRTTPGYTFAANIWYHVAATYDGSNFCLYINGAKVGSCTQIATTISTDTSVLKFGLNSAGGNLYLGYIDDAKVYSYARTAAQIKTDYLSRGSASGVATQIGSKGSGNRTMADNLNTGTGADGSITISSDTDINTTNSISGRSCADGGDAVNYSVISLTPNTASLSADSSAGCLAAGDEVLLINLQGTSSYYKNVGNYETLIVQSVTTSTVTFTANKKNYYGDEANDSNLGTATTSQRVMLQRIPNYNNVTINSGINFYPSAWNGVKNGVMYFRASGQVTINGTIHATGKGYQGGSHAAGGTGYQGEGISGTGALSNAAHLNGGGGAGGYNGGGGGGAYGTVGEDTRAGRGTHWYCSWDDSNSYSGTTIGTQKLYQVFFGGGGGGGDGDVYQATGYGATGGGIVIINAQNVAGAGSISSNGNTANNVGGDGAGGGGAGGTVYLIAKKISINLNATGGTGGLHLERNDCAGQTGKYLYGATGGDGGNGRIKVEYASSFTGASSPAATEGDPGPVGYWKMDEKVAGNSQTLVDSSANSNNGTTYYGENTSGMDCTKVGQYGSACQFDGIDDYVSVGNMASLDSANLKITVGAWVKTTATALDSDVGQRIFTTYRASNSSRFSLGLRLDKAFSYVNPAGSFSGTSAINDGSWHYIVTTYDGITQKLYVDGKMENSRVFTLTAEFFNQVDVIGAFYSADGFFNGLIDDVRIYNYARTPKQIMEDMNAGHPAVGSPVGSYAGYWKFDDDDGTIAYDSSINNNDGTLYGASSTSEGKFGKALGFDGTDDYVNITSSASLNPTSGITIAAWIFNKGSGGNGTVFRKESPQYLLRTASDTTLDFQLYIDGAYTQLMGGALTTNRWQHIVTSYDGVNMYIYVDGVLAASKAQTGLIATGDAPVCIGDRTAGQGAQLFKGYIDEVKIYPFALTADEIKTEYNKGSVMKLGAISTASDGVTPSDSASRESCVPGDASSTCSAPISYLKMDEGTGIATTVDSSGNSNSAAMNSLTEADWVSGKIGKALNFNNNDYLSINIDSWIRSANDVTISGWYYHTGDTNSAPWGIMTNSAVGSEDGFWWHIKYPGNALYLRTEDNTHGESDGTGTPFVSTGNWYYLTTVVGANRFDLYVNGALYWSWTPNVGFNWANINNDTAYLFIGKSYTSEVSVNGKIDDVKIYNYARTPAQIAWDYNRGKPVGYWKFDECQGRIAYDNSNNNNDGTIYIGTGGTQSATGTCAVVDAAAAWSNGSSGKYNSALSFDGTDDYVDAGTGTSLNFTNSDFTIATWFKASDAGGTLVERGLSQTDGYSLMYDPYVHLLTHQAGGYTYCRSQHPVTSGVWEHWVAVRQGTSVKLYRNGVEDTPYTGGNCNAIANPVTSARSLTIGKGNTWGWSAGLIDETKIYNYALTPDQILTDYNQGAAVRFGPSSGTP